MQMQGQLPCPPLCYTFVVFRGYRNCGKGQAIPDPKHQTRKAHKKFWRKLHLFCAPSLAEISDIIPSPTAFTPREWSLVLMGWEASGPQNLSGHDRKDKYPCSWWMSNRDRPFHFQSRHWLN
jgi:hypothetical protein